MAETFKGNKTKAAKVAMSVAFCLAVSKAAVGFLTGSLSILSSAVDSILDIAASFFNFIAIKKAEEPADTGHQYGHGKYEAMATFIQSIIIFVSGLFILLSAWDKFIHNKHPEVSSAGFVVMGISIAATIFLTIYLRYVAKKEKSSVLEADAMHYSIDLYTNIGILAALFIIKLTGWTVIDSIVAALVAIYIIFSAIKLSVQVSKQLLDSRIEEEAYNKLLKVLDSFGSYHLDFHRLRTRSAGNEIFIDMHLTLCRKLTLDEVHQITDVIENAISKEISGADITIHPEPCSHTDNDHRKCNSSRIREGLKKLQK
ncbi:cation diffusion facilitator family transporter [Mucispirillum schaedleri]|uniref:cation diffusion facilitator family transporter n=1 Tax=Mucispirillum schaedleri TaxID=248039 RepID=UPI001F5896DD|nr:cation diffusion facilitator family transporter [Mucispirillum schaedleri]